MKVIPSSDWAWASCSAANPFPGTPDPTQICLKDGFAPNKVHQVVFTAKNPYILGYVNAVKAAAANALARGFLLQEDADSLIAQAEASNVLNP